MECRIEGKESNDWKLVDAIDVIVHIFHPKKGSFMILRKCGPKLSKRKGYDMKKIFLILTFILYSTFAFQM